MMLTNLPMRKNRTTLWWAAQAYLTRRRIEETIRFVKQSFPLEDIRVRRHHHLRNMVVLTCAAKLFACAELGARMNLQILAEHVLSAARRVFGIPDFRYYAVTDGIS